MANILKNPAIQSDKWTVVTLAAGESPALAKLPAGPALVPLSVWQARREDLIRREWDQGVPFGLWLDPSDDLTTLADDLHDFSAVGVKFAATGDDRGYTVASVLRNRYGYAGELRAFGTIRDDQQITLSRAGFDAVSNEREDSLRNFTGVYQPAANQAQALRRPA